MKYVYIVHHSYMDDCTETANHHVFVFADEQDARDCAESIIRERRAVFRNFVTFMDGSMLVPVLNGEFVDACEAEFESECVAITRNKIGG